MGTVSLFLGIKNKDKTDLIFGVMALGLFVFLLMPPLGFISNTDQPPYSSEILIKRLFNFSYYGLMPWFIFYYTQGKNKIVPWLISLLTLVTYVMMATAGASEKIPLWIWLALLVFGAIFVYGLVASLRLLRHGKAKAIWLLIAFSFFGLLLVLTTLNQLTPDFFQRLFGLHFFFSIHLHALLLVFVMGFRMVVQINESFRLERIVKAKDKKWQSLMHFAPLFVVELDVGGKIAFINDFGVNLLGYQHANELIGTNWCDQFASDNRMECRQDIESLFKGHTTSLAFTNTIKTKTGCDYILHWVNYFSSAADHLPGSIICVGSDITQTVTAKQVIHDLQLELEKEKLTPPAENVTNLVDRIIGKSEVIRYTIDKAMQVAKTAAPVLLEGETGVGKELIADLIHEQSSRSTGPLVKVNCSALPKELVESELFGHEKGAFTSAFQARKGRFELAEGGTIFLDEVGELPIDMQPKLLRVLQSGEFERVGGQKTLKVDVRIIAATNRELAQEVTKSHFRDDLFYRLNVFPITIPPLRKRKDDLPLLINHFIHQEAKKYRKEIDQISRADLQRLTEYPWPGNIRELKNVIERSVIASEGNTLRLDWFFDEHDEAALPPSSLEDVDRQHILKVLESCHWKINGEHGAAEKLNMHPNTLRSRMKKLNIKRPVHDLF